MGLVTLIIPTVHHRAALFARALHYLEASAFAGPVVVSDHSPPERRAVIEEVAHRHGALDLTVLHHPPQMHFLERLALCAGAARTPYVHLHADDDFLCLRVLGPLSAEMEAADCVAAMGMNVHAEIETRGVRVLSKTPVAGAAPFERLIAQLESYSSALYALRRREELIATFSFTVEHCPDVQFWQYLESCVAALKGRVAVVRDLHYVRGVHDAKWSSTLVRERSPEHFPYLILSPQFQPRLAAFRAALIAASEACGAHPDMERLDAGLIHLLHRGLGAMGLPPNSSPAPANARNNLEQHLADANHPTTLELRRIFTLFRQ